MNSQQKENNMEKIDVVARIHELRFKRGWTVYQLGKQSNISEATIYNWGKRKNTPSVESLYTICESMGITLSEFFAGDEKAEKTAEEAFLLERYMTLKPKQKIMVGSLIDFFREENN